MEAAEGALDAALTHAGRHGLEQCEHAAAYRLGRLVGGTRGAGLEARALAWAESQNIRRPIRMLESWAPGLG
jgi:hypothetical protein